MGLAQQQFMSLSQFMPSIPVGDEKLPYNMNVLCLYFNTVLTLAAVCSFVTNLFAIQK